MTRIAVRLMSACLWCIAATNAAARDADGLLANIIAPNEGRPAVVAAGDTFDVLLETPAELRLIGATGAITLAHEIIETNQHVLARCTVPGGTPAGPYALEATSGDVRDNTAKAVWVVDDPLTTYTVALLPEPRVQGGEVGGWRAWVDAINASEAALVLILGNLTATGAAEDFRQMVHALAALNMPAFVSPGPTDRAQALYDAYFGPMPYALRFGPDGYLAIDTSRPTLSIPRDSGELYRLRRSIRAARWSAGFTHRYTAAMPLRDQITLFVDDPLDALVFVPESPASPDLPALGRVPFLGVSRFQTVQVTPTSAQATEPPVSDPAVPGGDRPQGDPATDEP